jgi:hypothetical protein
VHGRLDGREREQRGGGSGGGSGYRGGDGSCGRRSASGRLIVQPPPLGWALLVGRSAPWAVRVVHCCAAGAVDGRLTGGRGRTAGGLGQRSVDAALVQRVFHEVHKNALRDQVEQHIAAHAVIAEGLLVLRQFHSVHEPARHFLHA